MRWIRGEGSKSKVESPRSKVGQGVSYHWVQTVGMKVNRLLEYEVGDVVEVKPVAGGYPLPGGLPEGAQVRVIRLQPGWCAVERDGREWEVFSGCVVPRRPIRMRPTVAPRRCERSQFDR